LKKNPGKRGCVEGLCFYGTIEKIENGIILEGKLEGMVEVECIKCLNHFKRQIEEEVAFKVVPPPYSGFDDRFDIFEMERFSLEEILKSELESIRSEYNICPGCQNKKFDFII